METHSIIKVYDEITDREKLKSTLFKECIKNIFFDFIDIINEYIDEWNSLHPK